MNYGDILIESFKLLWREKKLWVLAGLGTLIFGLLMGFYMMGILGWQAMLFNALQDLEQGDFDVFSRWMIGYLALFFLFVIGGLVGYALNLISRAAIVEEAGRAWRGESTDLGRGLRKGLHKALAFLAIDFLWGIPMFVILVVAMGVGVGLMVLVIGDDPGGAENVIAFIGSMLAFMGLSLCVSLFLAAVKGVFGPLMYQASVQDDLSLGSAISRGWKLAKDHLGPMVIFLLLYWAVLFGLNILLRLVTMPVGFAFMVPYMGFIESLDQGTMPSLPSGFWLTGFLSSVITGLVSWLWMAFIQVFYYTYYARVYQELSVSETLSTQAEDEAG